MLLIALAILPSRTVAQEKRLFSLGISSDWAYNAVNILLNISSLTD